MVCNLRNREKQVLVRNVHNLNAVTCTHLKHSCVGGIVSHTFKVGGNKLNEPVRMAFRHRGNKLVGISGTIDHNIIRKLL